MVNSTLAARWARFPRGVLLGGTLVVASCDAARCSDPAPRRSAPASAISRSPLYASTDHGRTWIPVAGGLPNEIEVTFLSASGRRLVVGTEAHGLFIGDPVHGGWAPASAGLPGTKITAIHAADGALYTAVYEQGLFTSRDGGGTWTSLSADLADRRVRAILSVDDGGLLVGTDSGISRTSGGAATWASVFTECQVTTLARYEDTLLAGAACGTLASADGGATWAFVRKGPAAHNAAIVDGRLVVMDISGDLAISGDTGRTWVVVKYAPREGSYVYDTAQSGDHWVMSNNYGVHASADRGGTWELVHPTEEMVFIDLETIEGVVYGGTKRWAERRGRSGAP